MFIYEIVLLFWSPMNDKHFLLKKTILYITLNITKYSVYVNSI